MHVSLPLAGQRARFRLLAIEVVLQRLAARLLDLVQPLLRVLHVDLVPQQAGEQGLGAARGHAGAGEGSPLTATTARRRVHAHSLAPASEQTRSALVASSSLVRYAFEHHIVKIEYSHVVLHIIHAGIYPTARA